MTGLRESTTTPRHAGFAHGKPSVIIATDGLDQSDGAMAVGRRLASAVNALEVLTVVKPLPMVSPEMGLPLSADFETARRADQKRLVEEQAARVWGTNLVDVVLSEGNAASKVAEHASRTKAAMIVCGLGRHRVIDRVSGDETALRLIRGAEVPVLAVTPMMTELPSRIVVAVDFSETSLRAARLSLAIAASNATIYLANVKTRDTIHAESVEAQRTADEDANVRLCSVRERMGAPAGVVVQCVQLQPDPASELLAFAESVNADLIAMGSHGYGFVTRVIVGSVTTSILRSALRSVLCVPHAATSAAFPTTEPPVAAKFQRPEWSTTLDEFTRRNVGRRGT